MAGRTLIRIPALVAALALTVVTPVNAQTVNSTTDAYGGPQAQVLGNFGGGGNDVVPPPAAPAGGEVPTGRAPSTPAAVTGPVERGADVPRIATGELPFTGLETGLVAFFGLALLFTGFAMRRASRATA